jgi:maltooligosyltrehalose trehalohydrolase
MQLSRPNLSIVQRASARQDRQKTRFRVGPSADRENSHWQARDALAQCPKKTVGEPSVMDIRHWMLDLGARPAASGRVAFRVWAPAIQTVAVVLSSNATSANARTVAMGRIERGYFEASVPGVEPGARYRYLLDGQKERPDPASRSQPDGVHGWSAVVDPDAFVWSDQGWTGQALEELIIYELHTGTFTGAGSFEGIIPRLDYLRDTLGVTAIELMPVAQFPGARNWGYDGVFPFAPHSSYGGPDGLKRLVNACHTKGLSVLLDVVYNHLGPEGNCLHDYGPYFTDRYRTPWGQAINYDGPDSDEVRHYVVSNALHWVTEYHLDGLRLDAIHGIYDASATHILRELAEAVHGEAQLLGRKVHVIAESDLNDVRVISPPAQGGYGLDAQWSDDFHHALHTVLTGERAGYYEDFGRLDHLATAWLEGFVYSGQYSRHRRRRHGNSARHSPPSQLVVCAQNHDQVGNRAQGERLSRLAPHAALNVAAMAVLLGPNLPLLFMGEEYGEQAPFLYFTDHSDPALQAAVREGRRAEFASFSWAADVPDPQAPDTFERSKLQLGLQRESPLLRWYRRLIQLRTAHASLRTARSPRQGCSVQVLETQRVLLMHRWAGEGQDALLVLGFNAQAVRVTIGEPKARWVRALDSSSEEYGGPGAALPSELDLRSSEAKVELLPYGAAVYLKA